MNLTFTEYRSKVLKTMSTKFDMNYIVRMPGFSTWRSDNICANHWKLAVEVFECVLAMELYYVGELMVHPIKCDQCNQSMAEEAYVHATCNKCRVHNLDKLEAKMRSRK